MNHYFCGKEAIQSRRRRRRKGHRRGSQDEAKVFLVTEDMSSVEDITEIQNALDMDKETLLQGLRTALNLEEKER